MFFEEQRSKNWENLNIWAEVEKIRYERKTETENLLVFPKQNANTSKSYTFHLILLDFEPKSWPIRRRVCENTIKICNFIKVALFNSRKNDEIC